MLFERLVSGKLHLENRIVAEPVVSNSGDEKGAPTSRSLDIYDGYAKSGVGLAVIEQHAVHPWGRNRLNQFRLYGDDEAASLRPLTKLFEKSGVPVVAQLNFSGAGASDKSLLHENDFRLLSPSGARNPRDLIDADSQAIDSALLPEITDAFASAAQRAVWIAGYAGGVQIYACHGYLLGQFLSPLTNRRDDAYGGDLKCRARLLFETTRAVRAAIPDSILSVRLGASDQMPGRPETGLTLRESAMIAEELLHIGVDWIGVSGNHCIYGIGEDDGDTAYFSPYSSAIRNAVGARIPVDCAGGIRSREKAEELLQNGVCDLIGFGRPLVQNKAFVQGLRGGTTT